MYTLTRGYKGLQGVDKWLQAVTRGYRGLQGITGGYKGLRGVTKQNNVCVHYYIITIEVRITKLPKQIIFILQLLDA